ncbi:hypothetical protein L3X38_043412 [Prunus dulcis]|uniref:Organ-specific protein S2 n=1 Tax=Prunus dulcis TaxID=3755 RepID=A0AAD4UYI7_PRUDU|nr:hypothetical protein L3X38_043412 [Prunus dulcis]
MKFLRATLAFFSLLLFAKTTESRGGAGIDWEYIRKEQPLMPGLLVEHSDSTPKKEANCHENTGKPVVDTMEFEPRPFISAYNDEEGKAEFSAKDSEPKSQAYPDKQPLESKENKQSFDEDFDPRKYIFLFTMTNRTSIVSWCYLKIK